VKVPSVWCFVEELPHTPSGKVRKFLLREQWDQGAYAPAELTTSQMREEG
jgi:acyl-coenzyme A synthetase/AMP-(fatty) acid ligase